MEILQVMYLFLGLAGFILLLLYDLASLRQIKNRFMISVIGYGIHAYAVIMVALGDKMLLFPEWIIWLGWIFTLTGIWWLVYCLFLFPPIMRTYKELSGPVLTTKGPYAFSRHPGFLGYVIFIIGLIFISQSFLLLKYGLIWVICNFIYVIIQDRWIFRITFLGYESYSNMTPMIFPNAKSIKRFMQTTNMFTYKRGG